MIKITKTILWSLLAFALLSEGSAWAQPTPKEAAAMSVRKLDEGLYYMEYKGDDGFAGLMENGGGRSAEELSAMILNCDDYSPYISCIRTNSSA